MKLITTLIVVLSAAVASAQEPYQPQPYSQQFMVPMQVYQPTQVYQAGPPQMMPVQPQRPQYPRPRGAWGFGPFVMGYYW